MTCQTSCEKAEGRVFRVVICRSCGWQYGAWWLPDTAVGYWGDCPTCGASTSVETAFLPESRAVSGSPAQQELAL